MYVSLVQRETGEKNKIRGTRRGADGAGKEHYLKMEEKWGGDGKCERFGSALGTKVKNSFLRDKPN